MNKKIAHNWYRWLWFSPLLTIPTLAVMAAMGTDDWVSILFSAGWHLILLVPTTNKRDKFISWHGRQALLLAFARTLIALFCIDAPYFGVLLLTVFWFFGTRWGQKQAKQGDCTLMRMYLGDDAKLPISEPEMEEELARASKAHNATLPPASPPPPREIDPKITPALSCPNCGASEEISVKACSFCGKAYAAEDLLALRQLEYLMEQTANWDVPESSRAPYAEKLQKLRERLFPPQQAQITRVDPEPAPVKKAVVKSPPIPAKSAAVAVSKPAIKAEKTAPKPVVVKPVPKPKPAPKPKRDPIQWGKLWEKAVEMVVSGALLRGLLYLGAFMIVVSATILVVRFWDVFPEILQLILIFSVPTAFYLIGWLVRSRLKLPQAGGVLTGIGALMVAVDFAAVYQFGGLAERFNGNAYWLIASIICFVIYGITAWRIPGEFFDYLTLIGLGSAVLAFTRLLVLPYEWSVAAMVATGAAMIALAAKFPHPSLPPRGEGTSSLPLRGRAERGGWQGIARAARYLPQIAIPMSLVFVIFIPEASAWAQMSAFAFAALGYALLAWKFPATIFAHAAVWSIVGAVGFALFAVDLELEWYATAAGILAIPYILGGKLIERFTTEFTESAEILERKEKKEKSWQRGYQLAANIAGFGLTGIAILLGFFTVFTELWTGAFALTLVTVIFAGSAYLYKKPIFVFFAGGLFNIPFLFAFDDILAQTEQPVIWLMAAWGGLAIAYMGISLLLRKAEKYAQMLVVWAQLIMLPLLFGLLIFYEADLSQIPILIALGVAILFYLLSAFINHNEGHPALSVPLKKFPLVGQPIFVWATGFLFAIWISLTWKETTYLQVWLGAVLAGLALIYIAVGQLLHKQNKTYRFPLHFYAYLLFFSGALIAWSDQSALQITLYLAVVALAWLSYIYKRMVENTLAALLFIVPFQQSLELSTLPKHAYTLAYILLASLVYIPIGLLLAHKKKAQPNSLHELPVLVTGYSISVFSVIASLLGRFNTYPINLPWVGAVVPLIAAGLYIFSVYRFQEHPTLKIIFSSLSALTFAIAFGQTLTLLKILPEYDAIAWAGLGFAYLIIERALALVKEKRWFAAFHLPLGIGAALIVTLGMLLTANTTAQAFCGNEYPDLFPIILAQGLAAGFVILAARLYRNRLPLYLEPLLSFLAVTLFFIGYGERIFGQALTTLQYGSVWSGLAIIHLLAAALLDKNRIRYAHGLYLGSYTLSLFAISWTLLDSASLVWTLGLGILMAVASAFSVHFNHHRTWDEIMRLLFGEKENAFQKSFRAIFIWLAVWIFPFWAYLFLRQFEILYVYTWLGYAISALLLLGLSIWLRKIERVYAIPLYLASQFYIIFSLIISINLFFTLWRAATISEEYRPATLALIILQSVAVVFYAASAWVFYTKALSLRTSFSGEAISLKEGKTATSQEHAPRSDVKFRIYYIFPYVASILAFFPYTFAWDLYNPVSTYPRYAWIWVGLAAILLFVGYLLDRGRQVQGHARYAHGPYFVGYALIAVSIFQSAPEYLVSLYTLGSAILLASLSQILAHRKKHFAFEDFINFWWRKETNVRRVAENFFFFFAVYALPVWLAQLLTYHHIELAWRGFVLALLAPVYVAMGLVARRSKREYTWALYSAGYALTAIGAMIAFNDLKITIAVLLLNTVVYAISAYIFKEAFWLYLSTILAPVITLLSLHYYEELNDPWVSKIFMGLAFLYLLVGQLFDRGVRPHPGLPPQGEGTGILPPSGGCEAVSLPDVQRTEGGGGKISPFALPFYAPAFVLSAIALATASGERSLAILIYLLGALFYAISAWRFKESLFIYPASWLLAIPYYLGMTLVPGLETRWYGLGWLPLIVLYILLGRFFFHKKRIASPILAHPAMPFYLLGYALSVSLIALSASDPLALTLSFAAGAIIYLVSAGLFRRSAWFYPGLFAAHMALLSYFTIDPSGGGIHRISYPFLGMTWGMALVGYAFSRGFPVTEKTETGKLIFKFWRWEVDFGAFPFVGYLLTPSWSQPFFIFTVLDIVIWQSVALASPVSAIILAMGHALLLGLFALLWMDSALVYGSLAFFILAVSSRLHWAGIPFPQALAWFGGIGLGFYLLSLVAEQVERRAKRLSIWIEPLKNVGMFLSAFAVIFTLPFIASDTTASAAALAFAGTLYLAIAYKGHYYRLGYLGMGMLQLAWALVLIVQDVEQPQWYAIPAGLYFTGMGYLERQRGHSVFAKIIESFGLAVMLVTSFIQSVSGEEGFIYFIILLVEALLALWWGAARRQKIPFFAGLGASVLNVVTQVIVLVNVYDINRWIIILGVGLLLVTAAIFVERQREEIIARSKEWRETLDTWD